MTNKTFTINEATLSALDEIKKEFTPEEIEQSISNILFTLVNFDAIAEVKEDVRILWHIRELARALPVKTE